MPPLEDSNRTPVNRDVDRLAQKRNWTMPATDIPPVQPWDQRRKSLSRLAGGNERQLETLNWLLGQVELHRHTTDSLWRSYMAAYRIKASTARVSVQDVMGYGFLSPREGSNGGQDTAPVLLLSAVAQEWLRYGDDALAIGLLHANVQFVGELLHELRLSPLTRSEILGRAVSTYGLNWSTVSQVADRLCWLRSAGYVAAPDRSLRAVTSSGIEFLQRIDRFVP